MYTKCTLPETLSQQSVSGSGNPATKKPLRPAGGIRGGSSQASLAALTLPSNPFNKIISYYGIYGNILGLAFIVFIIGIYT